MRVSLSAGRWSLVLGILGVVALTLPGGGCTGQETHGKIVRADRLTTRPTTRPESQRPAGHAAFERRSYLDGKGGVLPFRVMYPENYGTTQRDYPLVLFLHGAGERGDDNEIQLTHGATQFTDPANRSTYPALVVFPQCPKGTSWAPLSKSLTTPNGSRDMNAPYPALSAETPKYAGLLKGMLDELARTERVDAKRVYVMGLSMGGMGTFDLIARYPDTFAAAVPICGGLDVMATKRFAPKVPVWVAHGDADTVVPVKWSRDVVAALELQDANPLYTEFRGVGHDSWSPMFAKAELLPWVFSKSKGQAATRPAGVEGRRDR